MHSQWKSHTGTPVQTSSITRGIEESNNPTANCYSPGTGPCPSNCPRTTKRSPRHSTTITKFPFRHYKQLSPQLKLIDNIMYYLLKSPTMVEERMPIPCNTPFWKMPMTRQDIRAWKGHLTGLHKLPTGLAWPKWSVITVATASPAKPLRLQHTLQCQCSLWLLLDHGS